jgi:cytochrome c peroxidase
MKHFLKFRRSLPHLCAEAHCSAEALPRFAVAVISLRCSALLRQSGYAKTRLRGGKREGEAGQAVISQIPQISTNHMPIAPAYCRLSTMLVIVTATLFSCKVDPPIHSLIEAAPLAEKFPAGWPSPVYTFSANPISNEKFELGRALFYDPILSRDNTISCGTCHQQNAAFANSDHRVSHGIDNIEGPRNAPPIFNMNWHPLFMHDGGINHLEVQPLGPISNPIEMDENISNVLVKLAASEKYRVMFGKAYGSEEITSERMLKAMAQFMGLMYSNNSKYDQFKRRENGVSLSDAEARGYSVFQEKCNGCHTEPLFSDFKFRNNGLKVDPLLNDSGRARITKNIGDLYKFKTPSLRNIALTSPYMHDGSISTLEKCLDHYSSGIVNHTNLDPSLEYGIPLSPGQKSDVIAFLKTLTDYTFVYGKRFSQPPSK